MPVPTNITGHLQFYKRNKILKRQKTCSQSVFFFNGKYTWTQQLLLLKKKKKVWGRRMYRDVHCSIMCDIKKLGTTHIFTDRDMITKWCLENFLLLIAIYPGNGIEEVDGEKSRQHLFVLYTFVLSDFFFFFLQWRCISFLLKCFKCVCKGPEDAFLSLKSGCILGIGKGLGPGKMRRGFILLFYARFISLITSMC